MVQEIFIGELLAEDGILLSLMVEHTILGQVKMYLEQLLLVQEI